MTRSIHFQIGVDGVCENIQSELELFLDTRPADYEADVVSDDHFNTHFKDVINSAGFILGENKFDLLGYSSNTILFLRPRFLYFGQPLNSADMQMPSAYKIETTLNLFPESDVTFHLFVSDHATYLSSHLSWLRKAEHIPAFSWRTLAETITSQLEDRGKLIVWDAENPETAMTRFASFAFGADPADVHPFFSSIEQTEVDHDALEQQLEQVGVNVDELDTIYESDLANFVRG